LTRFHPSQGRTAIALVLCLVGCLHWQPVHTALAAQTGQPPETTIYIVQPGDTLYDIAQQFGLTVDFLAAANGIDDPAHITIGQRLVIPPPPSPEVVSVLHAVQAGETLRALSLRFGSTAQELAEANYVVRADMLFVGQEIVVYGHDTEPRPLQGQSRALSSGDTLFSLAAQYQVPPWSLAAVNGLRSPYAAVPGQRLWLSGEEGEFTDWPEPLAGFRIHPIPAVQGQTVSIQISLTHPVSLTATWMGHPLSFHSEAGRGVTVAGIDALSEPALYTLAITTTDESTTAAHYSQRIPVVEGGYGFESISVSPEVSTAMTPEVVQSETELLDQLFSIRTPSPHWSGLFALPTAGDVTSAFGTRRTYNIAEASPYHTGTDFGTPIGTPVYAPADGVVVYSGPLTVRGNVIMIDHGWGVMTGYWHLSTSYVSEHDPVVAGQHIGDTGNSGLSTGPHLHWEMRVNGVPVSALQWVWEEFP
jgi:murein DD-endopeptidase MepM/ murein hydrolase activator NlpD